MGAVLWLASYPKSGNTWLRTFLHNLLLDRKTPVKPNELSTITVSDADRRWTDLAMGRSSFGLDATAVAPYRMRAQEIMSQSSPGTVLAKTHAAAATFCDVPTINPRVSAGAVYVLRDPRDVAISGAHHYGLTIDERLERLADPQNTIGADETIVSTFLSSWTNHVASWTSGNPSVLVVRYEDMEQKPLATFQRIVDFMKIKVPPSRLRRAVEFSAFSTLRQLEERHGFAEKTVHAERFFRVGKSGQWREVLTAAQIARLETDHGTQMRRFGYLD